MQSVSDQLLTRQLAAGILRQSLRSVDQLIATGEIEIVHIGRSIRIRPAALEQFIESRETRRNPRRAAKKVARKNVVKVASPPASEVPPETGGGRRSGHAHRHYFEADDMGFFTRLGSPDSERELIQIQQKSRLMGAGEFQRMCELSKAEQKMFPRVARRLFELKEEQKKVTKATIPVTTPTKATKAVKTASKKAKPTGRKQA